MEESLEEKQFRELLEEKRHNEIIRVLLSLKPEKLDNINADILEKLDSLKIFNDDKITKYLSSLKDRNKDEEIVSLLKETKSSLENIKQTIIEENSRMREWEFTIKRGQFNQTIEQVIAKQIK